MGALPERRADLANTGDPLHDLVMQSARSIGHSAKFDGPFRSAGILKNHVS